VLSSELSNELSTEFCAKLCDELSGELSRELLLGALAATLTAAFAGAGDVGEKAKSEVRYQRAEARPNRALAFLACLAVSPRFPAAFCPSIITHGL